MKTNLTCDGKTFHINLSGHPVTFRHCVRNSSIHPLPHTSEAFQQGSLYASTDVRVAESAGRGFYLPSFLMDASQSNEYTAYTLNIMTLKHETQSEDNAIRHASPKNVFSRIFNYPDSRMTKNARENLKGVNTLSRHCKSS